MRKNEDHYPLWNIVSELKRRRFVDLTHAFGPGIPHAPDMPDEVRAVLYDFEKDGFMAHRYDHVGQWGTHADPPVHFAEGGRTIDQIDVAEMLMPLVVFDVTRQVAQDADYAITINDIRQWEHRNGRIPRRAFAALRTDWSKRWPYSDSMANRGSDGISHTPGWSIESLEFLCAERDIGACGHETADTDPGIIVSRDEFPAETFILEQDRFQIELLTNLDQVPEAGSIIVASFPKPAGGSGFPARAFAIIP